METIVRSIVGRQHVGAHYHEVYRAVWSCFKRPGMLPTKMLRKVFRIARKAHRENRDLYAKVMSGSF